MGNTVREHIDTLVIGAGQAGLSMSYHLRRYGREHVLLERGRVGERWRSERWDTLRFQFPSAFVRLPDFPYTGDEPDAFMHRDGVVDVLQRYAQQIAAPVRCGVTAHRIRRGEGRRYPGRCGRSYDRGPQRCLRDRPLPGSCDSAGLRRICPLRSRS